MMSSFAARTAQQTRHLLFEAVIKGTLRRRRLGFAPRFARWPFKRTRLGHGCGLRNRPWLGFRTRLGFAAAWTAEHRLQPMCHLGEILIGGCCKRSLGGGRLLRSACDLSHRLPHHFTHRLTDDGFTHRLTHGRFTNRLAHHLAGDFAGSFTYDLALHVPMRFALHFTRQFSWHFASDFACRHLAHSWLAPNRLPQRWLAHWRFAHRWFTHWWFTQWRLTQRCFASRLACDLARPRHARHGGRGGG